MHLLDDIDDPLAKLYRQILRFIERDLTRIMDIAERVSVKSTSRLSPAKEGHVSGSPMLADIPVKGQGFEIMANVIWGEIGHAIMNELGGIVFSVGRPDDFRTVRFRSRRLSTVNNCLLISIMRYHRHSSALSNLWRHLSIRLKSCELTLYILPLSSGGNFQYTFRCGGRRLLGNLKMRLPSRG